MVDTDTPWDKDALAQLLISLRRGKVSIFLITLMQVMQFFACFTQFPQQMTKVCCELLHYSGSPSFQELKYVFDLCMFSGFSCHLEELKTSEPVQWEVKKRPS